MRKIWIDRIVCILMLVQLIVLVGIMSFASTKTKFVVCIVYGILSLIFFIILLRAKEIDKN